jgi:hypothetical protein
VPRALIDQCYAAKGAVHLLDMGGREIRYWNIFGADYLMARRVSITLVNLSEEPFFRWLPECVRMALVQRRQIGEGPKADNMDQRGSAHQLLSIAR